MFQCASSKRAGMIKKSVQHFETKSNTKPVIDLAQAKGMLAVEKK